MSCTGPSYRKAKHIAVPVIALVVLLAVHACAFRDDFNVLDTSVWDVHPNGGNISISDGKLILSADGTSHSRFPVLSTKTNPFPTSGDFTMKVGIRFRDFGAAAGVGAFGRGDGFAVTGNSDNAANAGATDYQECEFRYSNGQYECLFNGASRGSRACVRPVRIEIGNALTVPGGCRWTSFEVDYIEVLPATASQSPQTPAGLDAQAVNALRASGDTPQPAQSSTGQKGDANPINVLFIFAAVVIVFAIEFVKDKKTRIQLVFALVGIALLAIMANVSWNPLVALLFLLGVGGVGTVYVLVIGSVVRGAAHVATAPFRAAIEEHVHLAEQKAEISMRQEHISEIADHGFPTREHAPTQVSVIICQECGRANPPSATECTKCHRSIVGSQSAPSDRGDNQDDVLP